MVYYGMDEQECRRIHYGKYTPFVGQFWCPICAELRPGERTQVGGSVFPLLKDLRLKHNRE